MNKVARKNIQLQVQRARRGQGFSGCLIVIALILGGAIFAWNKFGKYHRLVVAGGEPTLLQTDNLAGKIEYERAWREHNKGWTVNNRNLVNKFYTQVASGKIKDRSEFDQRSTEILQSLLDGVESLDMHAVPKEYVAGHRAVGLGYRHFYECMMSLQKVYGMEGAERKTALEDTYKTLSDGWQSSTSGEHILQTKVPEIKH